MPIKVQGELEASISSSSLDMNREITANISNNEMNVKRASNANNSGSNIVEVYEGQAVTLTFVTEAYPPIRNQHWTTSTHGNNGNNNTVYQESYVANGYRLAC